MQGKQRWFTARVRGNYAGLAPVDLRAVFTRRCGCMPVSRTRRQYLSVVGLSFALLSGCHGGHKLRSADIAQSSVESYVSSYSNSLASQVGPAPFVMEDKNHDRLESSDFAMERDADCGSSAITDPPLADIACSGELPEHMAWFVRNMPDSHLFLTASEREEIARSPQSFKVVNGLGRRQDVVTVISHYSLFWVRSFEGPDPDVTIYLVYGPDCGASPAFATDPTKPTKKKCRPADSYLRDFSLYRVVKGTMPENVTSMLMPPFPRMSETERRRYGVYLRSQGEASDADIKLDVSRLVRTPVLRWVVRPVQEGDYEPPDMPASDPRAFIDYEWGNRNVAHFGFLAWNGRRMELRETVPDVLWPCRTRGSGPRDCAPGYDGRADRYLTPVTTERPGGPHDKPASHE